MNELYIKWLFLQLKRAACYKKCSIKLIPRWSQLRSFCNNASCSKVSRQNKMLIVLQVVGIPSELMANCTDSLFIHSDSFPSILRKSARYRQYRAYDKTTTDELELTSPKQQQQNYQSNKLSINLCF